MKQKNIASILALALVLAAGADVSASKAAKKAKTQAPKEQKAQKQGLGQRIKNWWSGDAKATTDTKTTGTDAKPARKSKEAKKKFVRPAGGKVKSAKQKKAEQKA